MDNVDAGDNVLYGQCGQFRATTKATKEASKEAFKEASKEAAKEAAKIQLKRLP